MALMLEDDIMNRQPIISKKLEFLIIDNILDANEVQKLIDFEFIDPIRMTAHPKIVGQSAYDIARMAGFEVNKSTKVLIGERNDLDWSDPFSREKLISFKTSVLPKDFLKCSTSKIAISTLLSQFCFKGIFRPVNYI